MLALLAGLLLASGLGQLTGIAESLSRIGGLLSGFLRVALLEVLLGSLHRRLGLLGGVLGGLGFLSFILLLKRLDAERLGDIVQLLGQLLGLLLELLLSLLLGFPPGHGRGGHLLQTVGQSSLPLGEVSGIGCQFLVRAALALRDFSQFLGSLFSILSGLLTGFGSGFDTASGQVLGCSLSLFRELIRGLGRLRIRTGLSFRVQGQFLGSEGDSLLIAEGCQQGGGGGRGLRLALLRLGGLWLGWLRLALLRLTCWRLACRWFTRHRLTFGGLTGFVHRSLSGIRIARLSGFGSQGPLFCGQFPCAGGESLKWIGGLSGTRLGLSLGGLTRWWFTRHWLASFRLSRLTSRLFSSHRQFLTRLLCQSIGLTLGLPGQLVQSFGGIGLSLRGRFALVLSEGLISGFGGLLSFRASQRCGDVGQLPHFLIQLLLRPTLLLQGLFLSLGIVGVLREGLFGLLLQFVLLRRQGFGLLGQGVQLGNARLGSGDRVLLILLGGSGHGLLRGGGLEGFCQMGESLRSLLLFLSRLLHGLLQLRSRGGRFGRARWGLRLLLGKLLDLLLGLRGFGESLGRSLLLGLRSDRSPQVGQFLLPFTKIVGCLIGLLRCGSLWLGGSLLSGFGTGLLFLGQGLSRLVRSLLLRVQSGGEVIQCLLAVGQSLFCFGELGRVAGGSVQSVASLIGCGLGRFA